MDWNWLPKNSGVPNLALCWWVQPSKTCLSTHKRVIIVSASDINLKQEKKKKKRKGKSFGRSFLLLYFFFFFSLLLKKGTGTVLGKIALK